MTRKRPAKTQLDLAALMTPPVFSVLKFCPGCKSPRHVHVIRAGGRWGWIRVKCATCRLEFSSRKPPVKKDQS